MGLGLAFRRRSIGEVGGALGSTLLGWGDGGRGVLFFGVGPFFWGDSGRWRDPKLGPIADGGCPKIHIAPLNLIA